ncbi:MAG: ATP F0F1 synthase subunit B [Alphaproteobacteria bacterium]|nr:ATP F0F1 synthase subunit B [Alphaproteobacteria bacterium]MBU1512693.1 ATP F0F1 synthase subunit B [Alphaproteobacteria bacterium]MBU2096296.1 ATP F0F1 synthase subunit B [Alphaproteobacteria bacterium]MBU2152428.1 ATP F0F1 synthase subunit B [Alphaproteobacteria bacterium]MBU2308039.1 ATP F0F1 synthase subunit B [Alphaproteobacteria bacterium]
MELLLDGHFWVGVAFVVFLVILVMAGVHKFAWKALGDAGAKVQGQLDEANALRAEAEALLAQVNAQKAASEKLATEILANAKEEATRLQSEAQIKLAEQLERRGQMAERKIVQAEAQAEAAVRAAAAELAAQMAEQVLIQRLAGAKSDPLIDKAIGQLAGKLQ